MPVTRSVSICDCSSTGTPVRGSLPTIGVGSGAIGPRHGDGGLPGPRTPAPGAGLPAVVTHKRHRGVNYTHAGHPGRCRGHGSGPVTKIHCRIGVAVHQPSTRGTYPLPLAELEISEVAAAAVVGLGRRKPAVGDHQPSTRPAAFVRQGRSDLAEPGLADRAAERPPAHATGHRLDVQILDDDGAVATSERGGEGVHLISAEVYCPTVEGRQLGVRLAVPTGADD